MKTRMMKCFTVLFAFAAIGYMAISMGVVRSANASSTGTTTTDSTGSSGSSSGKSSGCCG